MNNVNSHKCLKEIFHNYLRWWNLTFANWLWTIFTFAGIIVRWHSLMLTELNVLPYYLLHFCWKIIITVSITPGGKIKIDLITVNVITSDLICDIEINLIWFRIKLMLLCSSSMQSGCNTCAFITVIIPVPVTLTVHITVITVILIMVSTFHPIWGQDVHSTAFTNTCFPWNTNKGHLYLSLCDAPMRVLAMQLPTIWSCKNVMERGPQMQNRLSH